MPNFRSLNVRKNGDILEVKLSDSNYNRYHKDKARINDTKEMKKLMLGLKEKGVNFPKEFEKWMSN